VIMTSNIGSQHIARTSGKMGFQTEDRGQQFKDRRELVMGEVKRTLSPEFINRIDEVIVFDTLTEDQLRDIARIMIQRLNRGLAEQKIELQVTGDVCDLLVNTTCEDRSYGARPLRRAIQRYIEDALSDALISGNLERGPIEVYLEGEQVRFRAIAGEAAPSSSST
jgi:ATP-dependent Clp protease ATP-binding subunit ClpC